MGWLHLAAGAATVFIVVASSSTVALGAGGAESCDAAAKAYEHGSKPRALFELAECHEKAGELKTAMDHYNAYLKKVKRLDGAAQARQQTQISAAKTRLASLGVRVPLLTIKLPGDPSDYVVKIDGEDLSGGALKLAQPINPGRHRVEIEMPNGAMRRFDAVLGEGDSRVIDVARSSGTLSAPGSEQQQPPEGESDQPSEPASDDDRAIPLRTWAYVAGGIGAAGIIVGSITGGLAIGGKSTMDDNCNGEACNHEGKEAADETQALALVSTIGFPVGLAGLAAGTALWLLSPSQDGAAATGRLQIEPLVSQSMIGVRGTW